MTLSGISAINIGADIDIGQTTGQATSVGDGTLMVFDVSNFFVGDTIDVGKIVADTTGNNTATAHLTLSNTTGTIGFADAGALGSFEVARAFVTESAAVDSQGNVILTNVELEIANNVVIAELAQGGTNANNSVIRIALHRHEIERSIHDRLMGMDFGDSLNGATTNHEMKSAREALPPAIQAIVGDSPQIRIVREIIQELAAFDTTVLIEGETGTGKELAARAVHELSARRNQPFLELNCAGLTVDLAASQLFGHCQGAFTGAVRDRVGMFQAASEGTLFLDEIGELPLPTQTALLRVLEERAVMPVVIHVCIQWTSGSWWRRIEAYRRRSRPDGFARICCIESVSGESCYPRYATGGMTCLCCSMRI